LSQAEAETDHDYTEIHLRRYRDEGNSDSRAR